jgi:hypothetical protein
MPRGLLGSFGGVSRTPTKKLDEKPWADRLVVDEQGSDEILAAFVPVGHSVRVRSWSTFTDVNHRGGNGGNP